MSIRAALVLLCSLLAGCVRVPVEPIHRTELMTVRSGDQVTLAWKTEPDVRYTITYTDRIGSGARWTPLPQATGIKGDGRTREIIDRVPAGRSRYYNVVTEFAPR